jgi:hypothetical protein
VGAAAAAEGEALRMAKKGRRRSRWASEAAQQALVRFGPEESGIRAARRSAEDTFRTTSRQADATSAGIQAAISRVRPEVQHDYDAAGLQAARAAHVAEPDLAAANVPASLRAAVAAERFGEGEGGVYGVYGVGVAHGGAGARAAVGDRGGPEPDDEARADAFAPGPGAWPELVAYGSAGGGAEEGAGRERVRGEWRVE